MRMASARDRANSCVRSSTRLSNIFNKSFSSSSVWVLIFTSRSRCSILFFTPNEQSCSGQRHQHHAAINDRQLQKGLWRHKETDGGESPGVSCDKKRRSLRTDPYGEAQRQQVGIQTATPSGVTTSRIKIPARRAGINPLRKNVIRVVLLTKS